MFAEEVTQEVYVQALMQGNIQEETALEVMKTVLGLLNGGSIKEKSLIEDRTIKLPVGNHIIVCHNLNSKDVNTVTTSFYQIGNRSLYNDCILSLLIMTLESPIYDTLRTKQQLGYYVNISANMIYGIMGYTIYISSQETKHTADHVRQCVEAFHRDAERILSEISLEDFKKFKNSLIKLKQIKDVTLCEEVERNWAEIVSEECLFERRDQEINILKTIEKQDVIEFWLKHSTENLRNLTIQVVGSDKTDESKEKDVEDFNKNMDLEFLSANDTENTISISDLTEFKSNLDVYPVTKTRMD